MQQPTIRPATRDDLPGMAAVLNPIIRKGGTTAYEEEFTPEALGRHVFDATGLVSAVVAVDDEGGIAGFQYLARHDGLPEGVGDIASFARMEPKLPGVGRAMLKATVAAARAAGLTAINAQIRADNQPGLGYYSAMGFQDHSLDRGVPLKDGTPVDRVHKRLIL